MTPTREELRRQAVDLLAGMSHFELRAAVMMLENIVEHFGWTRQSGTSGRQAPEEQQGA